MHCYRSRDTLRSTLEGTSPRTEAWWLIYPENIMRMIAVNESKNKQVVNKFPGGRPEKFHGKLSDG